jgi:transposase
MSDLAMRVFSTAFKVDVVGRLEAGEALAAVSRELGIARKLLYEWRAAWREFGVAGLNRNRGPKPGRRPLVDRSDLQREEPALARAKARIAELECVIGRQQVDIDFFHKALRLADAPQPAKPVRGARASMRSSKP